MAELVLGKPKTANFGADILLFSAGPNPLGSKARAIWDWLTERGIAFKPVDALKDPVLATLLEAESSKGLLPILYANGRLIGCESLENMLRNPAHFEHWLHVPQCQKVPQIRASQRALEELRRVSAGENHRVRLSISAEFAHELTAEATCEYDWLVEFDDVVLALDPLSTARADGLAIDWLSNGAARGFFFENPNRALGLVRMGCEDLVSWLQSSNPPLLIDVRTEAEYLDGRLPEARWLDTTLVEALSSLDRSTSLAFYCNNGVRSLSVARRYGELGFIRVAALEGGIEAWKQHIGDQTLYIVGPNAFTQG